MHWLPSHSTLALDDSPLSEMTSQHVFHGPKLHLHSAVCQQIVKHLKINAVCHSNLYWLCKCGVGGCVVKTTTLDDHEYAHTLINIACAIMILCSSSNPLIMSRTFCPLKLKNSMSWVASYYRCRFLGNKHGALVNCAAVVMFSFIWPPIEKCPTAMPPIAGTKTTSLPSMFHNTACQKRTLMYT